MNTSNLTILLPTALSGSDSVSSSWTPGLFSTGVAVGVVVAIVLAVLKTMMNPARTAMKVAISWVVSACKTCRQYLLHICQVATAGIRTRRDARFAKRVRSTPEGKALFAAIELHGVALQVLCDLAERGMLRPEITNSTIALDVCMLRHYITTLDDRGLPGQYTKAHPNGPAILGSDSIHRSRPGSRHPLLREFIDEMCHRHIHGLLFSRQMKTRKYLVINVRQIAYCPQFMGEEGQFDVWLSDDGLTGISINAYGSYTTASTPVNISDAYLAARTLWASHGKWKDDDKYNEDPVPPYRDLLAAVLSDPADKG